MSDQFKTLAAYIIGLSILMFAWSVFKTWEPPIAPRGSVATEARPDTKRPSSILPTQVAAE